MANKRMDMSDDWGRTEAPAWLSRRIMEAVLAEPAPRWENTHQKIAPTQNTHTTYDERQMPAMRTRLSTCRAAWLAAAFAVLNLGLVISLPLLVIVGSWLSGPLRLLAAVWQVAYTVVSPLIQAVVRLLCTNIAGMPMITLIAVSILILLGQAALWIRKLTPSRQVI